MTTSKYWINKPLVELLYICLTPFICLGIVFAFPQIFINQTKISTTWWVILILLIDVGHVYSTIYRTYLNKEQWKIHKKEMIVIPILSLLFAIVLYQISISLFWRVVTYTAVFHFIRQQYGIMKVYDRFNLSKLDKKINAVTIYSACIYPLIYWHCFGPFEFNWFIDNDFLYITNPMIHKIAFIFYLITISIYYINTLYKILFSKIFNLPLFLIITGTVLSWYFGIVYQKSDLTFTLINVVSHGIPYIALIWIFEKKRAPLKTQFKIYKIAFKKNSILLFFIIPALLGFIEEGYWDTLVWKEHNNIFIFFKNITPNIFFNLKAILIPFLIVPQLTHYALDGFIWKISKGHINK